jgi:hypothetical protein
MYSKTQCAPNYGAGAIPKIELERVPPAGSRAAHRPVKPRGVALRRVLNRRLILPTTTVETVAGMPVMRHTIPSVQRPFLC